MNCSRVNQTYKGGITHALQALGSPCVQGIVSAGTTTALTPPPPSHPRLEAQGHLLHSPLAHDVAWLRRWLRAFGSRLALKRLPSYVVELAFFGHLLGGGLR